MPKPIAIHRLIECMNPAHPERGWYFYYSPPLMTDRAGREAIKFLNRSRDAKHLKFRLIKRVDYLIA